MNDWLIAQGITSPQLGLVLGLAAGLFAAVIVAWVFSRRNAVLETRIADRDQHYQEQIRKLEEAEHRLSENFERLAGRIFEDRSERLSDLNAKQLDAILKHCFMSKKPVAILTDASFWEGFAATF